MTNFANVLKMQHFAYGNERTFSVIGGSRFSFPISGLLFLKQD